MKLIDAKCPKCKELIEVDGDSESTKCNHCGEKIEVKDALVEKMISISNDKDKKEKINDKVDEEIISRKEIEEDTSKEEEELEEVVETEITEYNFVEKDDALYDEDDDEDDEDDDENDEDDDENDDDDDENDDDEEEFDEDIEQEKIVEEKSNIETEKKQSAKKKLSKDKIEEKDRMLREADKLLGEWEDKEAYDICKKVLEIDPNDSYCRYRINYILLRNDFYNKEKLNDLYESFLKVDYCFDETGNKTDDISIVHEEFADCIVTVAWSIRKQIYDNGAQSFDSFKKKFNILYSVLYVLEKFAKEDLDEEVQAKTYIYILVVINYLKDRYVYRDKYTKNFQDKEHLELLKDKHSKYLGKLRNIDSSYAKNYIGIFSKIIDRISEPYYKKAMEEKKNSNSIRDKIDVFAEEHKIIATILFFIILMIVILFIMFIFNVDPSKI